jgi:hypothetical protein
MTGRLGNVDPRATVALLGLFGIVMIEPLTRLALGSFQIATFPSLLSQLPR